MKMLSDILYIYSFKSFDEYLYNCTYISNLKNLFLKLTQNTKEYSYSKMRIKSFM